MKTTLKKLLGGATLGLALLANTAPTWAGAQIPLNAYEVSVGANYAHGSLIAARYSKDKKQIIGCRLYGTPAYWFGSCSAADSTGASLGCLTSNPAMLAAISSITDSSILTFTMPYGSSECSDIQVDNSSAYLK